MANTTAVYARIDTDLKERAETILAKLGISPSSAIQMLYSQIIIENGMPFVSRLPERRPTTIGGMSDSEVLNEIQKGIDSMKNSEGLTPDEVDAELNREFGI